MGLSLEQFQAGAASVGDVIGKATDLWNQVSGKKTVAAQTTQPAQAAAPAASPPAGQTLTQGGSGLASIPPWVFLVLGVGALWVLSGRRGG